MRTSVLLASAAAAAMLAGAAAAPPATPPTFLTWWANINSTMVQKGGSTRSASGVGAWQVDASNNKTAWVHGTAGGNFVADFSAQVVYMVDAQGVCQTQCKLQGDTPCNSQLNGNALCGYDYEHRSKYMGQVTLPAGKANHYRFLDPLGPITMAQHDLYLSSSTGMPLRYFADFEPFGSWVANVTSDYTNFKTTPPPASLFAVSNVKYCPDHTDDDEGACSNTLASFAGHMLASAALMGKHA